MLWRPRYKLIWPCREVGRNWCSGLSGETGRRVGIPTWTQNQRPTVNTAIFAAKFSNIIGVPLVAFAIVNLGSRRGASASRRS